MDPAHTTQLIDLLTSISCFVSVKSGADGLWAGSLRGSVSAERAAIGTQTEAATRITLTEAGEMRLPTAQVPTGSRVNVHNTLLWDFVRGGGDSGSNKDHAEVVLSYQRTGRTEQLGRYRIAELIAGEAKSLEPHLCAPDVYHSVIRIQPLPLPPPPEANAGPNEPAGEPLSPCASGQVLEEGAKTVLQNESNTPAPSPCPCPLPRGGGGGTITIDWRIETPAGLEQQRTRYR